MFGLGAGEIVLILILALVFVGPKKIPELAKGLGKGIREFQKAKNEFMEGSLEEREERGASDKRETAVANAPEQLAQNAPSVARTDFIETTAIKKSEEEHRPHTL